MPEREEPSGHDAPAPSSGTQSDSPTVVAASPIVAEGPVASVPVQVPAQRTQTSSPPVSGDSPSAQAPPAADAARAAPLPAQPASDQAQPPTDQPQTTADPAQPSADPAKPPADQAQPPTHPPQPPADPAQPQADPAQPADLAQRSADPAQRSADPAQRSADDATPVGVPPTTVAPGDPPAPMSSPSEPPAKPKQKRVIAKPKRWVGSAAVPAPETLERLRNQEEAAAERAKYAAAERAKLTAAQRAGSEPAERANASGPAERADAPPPLRQSAEAATEINTALTSPESTANTEAPGRHKGARRLLPGKAAKWGFIGRAALPKPTGPPATPSTVPPPAVSPTASSSINPPAGPPAASASLAAPLAAEAGNAGSEAETADIRPDAAPGTTRPAIERPGERDAGEGAGSWQDVGHHPDATPTWQEQAPERWPAGTDDRWARSAPERWPADTDDGWPKSAAEGWPEQPDDDREPRWRPVEQPARASVAARVHRWWSRLPTSPRPGQPGGLRWMAVTAALQSVLCAGAMLALITPSSDQYPASVEVNSRVPGLVRVNDAPRRVTAERMLTRMRTDQFDEQAFVALYAEGTNRQRQVTLFGVTRLVSVPARELDAAMQRLSVDLQLKSVREFPAGSLGGEQRCGAGRLDNRVIIACGWADHGSIAIGVFSGRTEADGASLLRTVRANVLHRGA
jgi:hypothetical protein